MLHPPYRLCRRLCPVVAAAALVTVLMTLPAAANGAAPQSPATAPAARNAPVRGADELYWTPTLEQALEMSAATGRPVFLMGYSLVGDGSTYTKLGPDYCTGVY